MRSKPTSRNVLARVARVAVEYLKSRSLRSSVFLRPCIRLFLYVNLPSSSDGLDMSIWTYPKARHICSTNNTHTARQFHDYFVTHLPSSSLHPDSRSSSGPHHGLPRSASKPHSASSPKSPAPAPLIGTSRETTVVRIPLRSAKHHFGVSISRGQRPYNEDSYQAGVIELPAFAKRAPLSLSRAPASSPLQAYRERQLQEKASKEKHQDTDGEGTAAGGANGDPQVFYFGVFDGHGGAECSDFLREKLHDYIESAAEKYNLQSTLKRIEEKPKKSRESDPQTPNLSSTTDSKTNIEPLDSLSEPSTSLSDPPTNPHAHSFSASNPTTFQNALTNRWREVVGGYFRRFRPTAFAPDTPITISTILTHAFLSADLDFITAQSRKLDQASDIVISDGPLNASDTLQPRAHSIGGPAVFKGGSTCSLALISTPTPTPFWHPSSPSTLLTAHVGDTRILLSRVHDGSAIPLTTNHHPSTTSETSRLRRYAGAFVTDSFGEERMSGLANTRSFGDMSSKRIGVSAEPELRTTELKAGEYAFMVLVSDGVSGTLGDQEIVDIVKEARTPEEGAREVVSFATEVSSEGDNATCLVVRLGGWERRSEGGGGSLGTREGREWRRREAGDPRRGRT